MAGDAMAGDAMAGDAMAGDAMASDAMAGDAMAGDAMADQVVATIAPHPLRPRASSPDRMAANGRWDRGVSRRCDNVSARAPQVRPAVGLGPCWWALLRPSALLTCWPGGCTSNILSDISKSR